MVVISDSKPVFTTLLVFTCESEEQTSLVEQLSAFIEQKMKPHPGFLSAVVYAADNGTQVIEHFQWQNQEDYIAYRSSEDGRSAFEWLSRYHPQVYHLKPEHIIVNES